MGKLSEKAAAKAAEEFKSVIAKSNAWRQLSMHLEKAWELMSEIQEGDLSASDFKTLKGQVFDLKDQLNEVKDELGF